MPNEGPQLGRSSILERLENEHQKKQAMLSFSLINCNLLKGAWCDKSTIGRGPSDGCMQYAVITEHPPAAF